MAVLVGVSTLARGGAIGMRVPAPWILPDEIVYSELAKSIAAGHRPAVRGVPVFGWGEVYPALVAPAWALFDGPVDAYHAALWINALVMSSAAVPAFLLARLFVSQRASFLVAVMTVLVPSMAYTGVVMTESACYPVFLVAVYLIARAVRKPTAAAQALALLGLLLLAFTRIQGLALVGAFACAVVLFAGTSRTSRGTYLRRVAPSVVLAVAATLAPVLASLAAGDGAFGWLGPRSGTFAVFHPAEIPEWFAYLAGDLVLYVAVAPVAATVVVAARGLVRGADERLRLYTAIVVPTLLAILASVAFVSASLDVDGTENLNERYAFYVVPLLFVGLALWIEDGLPRRAPWSSVVVACCFVLALVIPIDRLHYNSRFQSPGLLPWISSSLSGIALEVAVSIFVVACGVLWITCRRERAGRLWLVTAVWISLAALFAVGSASVAASDSATQSLALPGARAGSRTPFRPAQGSRRSGTSVPSARTGPIPYFRLMVAEFFDPAVGDVYRIGPRTLLPRGLPADGSHHRAW